jgi:phospholipase/carboxylesterase
MAELQTVEVETGEEPRSAVIWMHGLGADAHDFEPVVPLLSLGPELPVRYVFPNAPSRPVTINGGMVMPAWYDIRSFDRDADEDEAGLRESAAVIEGLVEREVGRGITAERIALAGFSQGGALALFTALRHVQPLAGVIALSAYLPLAEIVAAERSGDPSIFAPIFMAHGTEDDVVPINFGRSSRRKLHQQGYAVSWNEYPMPHTVIPPELEDIKAFLSEIF